MSKLVLGLDIGGANLKAALSDGTARSRPFALWKNPNDLANQLTYIVDGWSWDRVGITMTGELCDCFATKRDGVRHIVEAARQIFGEDCSVWRTDDRFAGVTKSLEDPLPCAASNWLALATFAGRFVPQGQALLLDIGSTTTDIIPLHDGIPCPAGRTDIERMWSKELVYTGVRRTPLCAILGWEAMAEFYATTQDAYLTLDLLNEDPTDCDTADNRPATKEWAHSRLAHMLGGDLELISKTETKQLAERVQTIQETNIASVIQHVLQAHSITELNGVIVSGAGEFLARRVVEITAIPKTTTVHSLADQLGNEVSSAACAYAVATLLAEGNYGPC